MVLHRPVESTPVTGNLGTSPDFDGRHSFLARRCRFWTDPDAYLASIRQSRHLLVEVSEKRNVFVNVRDKCRGGSATFRENRRHTEPYALR